MPNRNRDTRSINDERDAEIAYRAYNWDDEGMGRGYGSMDDQEQRPLGGQGEIDAGARGPWGAHDVSYGDPAAYDRTLAYPPLAWPGEPTQHRRGPSTGLREQSVYGGQGLHGERGPRDWSHADHAAPGGFRGKGPAGHRRSDERILDEVCHRLTEDHHVDASRIEVKVEAGEVTLTGAVSDRRSKRRAEHILDGVPGVVDVHNRIRIEG